MQREWIPYINEFLFQCLTIHFLNHRMLAPNSQCIFSLQKLQSVSNMYLHLKLQTLPENAFFGTSLQALHENHSFMTITTNTT